jgi:hypothetical protein
MSFVTIEPMNVAAVERMLAAAPQIAREELQTAMDLSVVHLEAEVKDRTPTAFGTLRASIFGETRLADDGLIGVVASPLAYAAYVELGTKPHFPPVEALLDWVKVKFGLTDEADIERAAFLVARKIAAHGTEGAKMFEQAFNANRVQLEALWARVPDKIAARLDQLGGSA